MSRETFRAMGAEVAVVGASKAELAAVTRLFDEWDGVFSRFRPGSELNLVNESALPAVLVSPLFARVLGTALAAAEATGGLVDPTLGVAIEAAGYDRDLSRLDDDERPLGATAPGSWRALRLRGRVLWRTPGTRLDLNGVVKALAVDDALRLARGPGLVSAGGDLAARGGAVVGLPEGGSVRLSGGLATSGTTHRRWTRGGGVQHHLIDPRTGRPASSRWTQVTVAAASCVAADVAAKAAFLLSGDGPGWLEERGLPGRFLDGESVVTNDVWRRALVGAAA